MNERVAQQCVEADGAGASDGAPQLNAVLDDTMENDVNGSSRLEIVWNGELVGYMDDISLETVVFGISCKMRGQWVPLELPATAAFLDLLKESPRLEVTVNEEVPGMKTVFSMGMDGEAWLYRRDLIGLWKRLIDSSAT